MRNFKLLFFALTVFTGLIMFSSCGDDDDNVAECSGEIATGSINGKNFNFLTGRAVDVSDGVDFKMFSDDVSVSDVCSFNSSFGDNAVSIFGTLPSAELGRTELFLEPDFSDGYTITLFDAEEFDNIIAVDGFIEITEVTEETIKGYLKADASGGDKVCGTFELTRC